MAEQRLNRHEANSPGYKAALKVVDAEMATRREAGRRLQELLSQGGIDVGMYRELKLRYDPAQIEEAIRDFGQNFRSHLSNSDDVPRGPGPEGGWQPDWEERRDARQPAPESQTPLKNPPKLNHLRG